MFNSIKTFLADRKKKNQLSKVLRLLYSNIRYELIELVQALNTKDELEEFEYYIIIEIAAKLDKPYTSEDIDIIYDLQLEAYESYVASEELRENIKKLVKIRAELSLLNFNAFMDMQRRAYEFNKYSPGGMLLRTLISKGRPLTLTERIEVDEDYKKIKAAEDNHAAILKEAEESFKKQNPLL